MTSAEGGGGGGGRRRASIRLASIPGGTVESGREKVLYTRR